MIRTMEQLEVALDAHNLAKWQRATVAAIEAGNTDDAVAFANRAIRDHRQQQADRLALGDEPQLLADIRDERIYLPLAA